MGFLFALEFLTRLPSLVPRDTTRADPGRGIAWFPIVGALIGFLLAFLDEVLRHVVAAPVANALLVAGLAALTGALHLDGLIDTADGLAAGHSVQAQLAAMRRTVAGVPGAVAGCLMIFSTYLALGALDHSVRTAALVIAPLCGRTAILLGYAAYPYGRDEETLSSALKRGATWPRAALGLVAAFAISLAIAGAAGVAVVAAALTGGLILGRLALRRLPGLTGDLHGAICETCQLAALLLAPVVLLR